jgi:hypothetical protein
MGTGEYSQYSVLFSSTRTCCQEIANCLGIQYADVLDRTFSLLLEHVLLKVREVYISNTLAILVKKYIALCASFYYTVRKIQTELINNFSIFTFHSF